MKHNDSFVNYQQRSEVLKREPFYDFLKSVFMLFVFFHHFYLTLNHGSYENDYFKYLNPFAELFVGLAGFMIGYVFLHREKDPHFMKRGFKILLAYFVVAIPVGFVLVTAAGESFLNYLFDIVLLNANVTYIGILKFYGVLFLLLPLILVMYRKSRVVTMLLSVIIFGVTTWVYSQYTFHNPFMTYTLVTVLQWQLFFIIGILIGDLKKRDRINFTALFNCSLILGLTALVAQLELFNGMPDEKVPYHIPKLLNTLYLVPVYLYFFKWVYEKTKGTILDRTIRTVGRNSLQAFVLSEFIRFFVIAIPIELFNIHVNVVQCTMISVVMAVLLMLLIAGLDRKKHVAATKQILISNGRG